MEAIPGTLQEGPFLTTQWSVIAACNKLSPEEAQAALSQLCRNYWPPLYSFLRHRGYSREEAQDLVQEFFVFLLQSKAYAQADPNRGKFRSFLLASLKNYLSDVWHRERSQKRGGAHEFVLVEEEMEAAEALYASDSGSAVRDEEQQYEWRWAAALLARALDRLEAEFGATVKARLFTSLKPFLTGGTGLPNQEETAAQLGMPVETLRSHLSRLRARYRQLFREEVAATISLADDLDEEVRHLFGILIAGA